jgi:hypothetical protein
MNLCDLIRGMGSAWWHSLGSAIQRTELEGGRLRVEVRGLGEVLRLDLE